MATHYNLTGSNLLGAKGQILDSRLLRDALGYCPTGVAIVSAVVDGQVEAMTIGSFASLSLDPALVMWNIQNTASRYTHFAHSQTFEVSVLSCEQREIADAYARRETAVLADTHKATGGQGALHIHNAAAHFECKTYQTVEAGDHLIIIGRVLSIEHDSTVTPLVFCRGRYGSPLEA